MTQHKFNALLKLVFSIWNLKADNGSLTQFFLPSEEMQQCVTTLHVYWLELVIKAETMCLIKTHST